MMLMGEVVWTSPICFFEDYEDYKGEGPSKTVSTIRMAAAGE